MTYVRMYETEQQALVAFNKLKEDGFPTNTILLVTPGANAEAVLGFTLGSSDAKILAQSLERGRSIVLVRAAFGFGQAAINILESCGPVDSHLLAPPMDTAAWEEAGAPLSTALQWPVLKRNEPAPFSDFLGIPLISSREGSEPTLISKFSGSSIELSFGYRLLSSKATPLSSLFGLETLMGQAGPADFSFGLPLRMDNPAPLSSFFGLPLLSSQR